MFLSVNIVQCATDNRNSYRLSEHCKFPCFFLLIKMSLSKKITDPLTGFQSIGSNSNFLLLYRVENYLHREHFENNNGGLFALKMLNKPKYPSLYGNAYSMTHRDLCFATEAQILSRYNTIK